MDRMIDVETWRQLVANSFAELGATLGAFVPNLMAAALILVFGWIVSRIVQGAARRLLGRLGLDRSGDSLGMSDSLEQRGLATAPSELVARMLFWVLMLTFVLSAVETLGLTAAAATIDRLVAFLPNVIAAGLVLFGGLVFGRLAGAAVASGAAATRVANADRLGAGVQFTMVGLAGVLALGQVGIDTAALVTVLTAVVISFGVTAGVAIAIGARDVVAHILAGHYLRASLPVGRRTEVDGRSGVVERVGPVSTSFREGDATWTVPNAQLLETTIVH